MSIEHCGCDANGCRIHDVHCLVRNGRAGVSLSGRGRTILLGLYGIEPEAQGLRWLCVSRSLMARGFQ